MRIGKPLAVLAAIALAFAGCSASSAKPAGKTLTIRYGENCQIELIASGGQRIMIDVWDPTKLSSPARASDILLTSHLHSDHYNQAFVDSFPGQKVTNQAGTFTFNGITIDSLDASHTNDNVLTGAQASNHIFVFDFDGFRIAHMGSTGQTHFTDAQMAKLGKVDIAFMDFVDVGGSDNTKPLTQITQLQPKLAFATHSALAPVQLVGKQFPASYSTKESIKLSYGQLPSKTTLFFMGQLAMSYGAILGLKESSW